jgi:hypothetical protein
LDALAADLPARGLARKYLGGSRYRLLALEMVDRTDKKGTSLPPTHYRAVYYNYTKNHAVRVTGAIAHSGGEKVTVSHDQPLPSPEEYDAAVARLREDELFGAALRGGRLLANPALPPVLDPETAGQGVERTLNIMLLAPESKGEFNNEIVGVNLVRNEVVRFESGAPPAAKANPQACGIPSAGQGTSSSGMAGQYQFQIIAPGGAVIWEYLALRPSASSGPSDRSGIELRDVKYQGRLVLKRLQAPILNVGYEDGACGPYRAWQWQEGMFQANGTDLAPGVRDCGTQVVTTALDTGNDVGNFRGIAFYRQGPEVVMVSEMNAGWYRYVCEYRLAGDGTIRPRYGYGSTNSGCACRAHTYHVYWRMDFDIDGPAHNEIVPSPRDGAPGRPSPTETRLFRDPSAPVSWLVQNSKTLHSYLIRPNNNDGFAATSDGRGDLWFLKYQAHEISDREAGVYSGVAAHLDAFVNQEALTGDIVVWYGGHFTHHESPHKPDITGPDMPTGTQVQGPDLVPLRWSPDAKTLSRQ